MLQMAVIVIVTVLSLLILSCISQVLIKSCYLLEPWFSYLYNVGLVGELQVTLAAGHSEPGLGGWQAAQWRGHDIPSFPASSSSPSPQQPWPVSSQQEAARSKPWERSGIPGTKTLSWLIAALPWSSPAWAPTPTNRGFSGSCFLGTGAHLSWGET